MFGLQTNEIRDRIGLVGEEALNQVLVTSPTITGYGSSAAPKNLPHSHDSYKKMNLVMQLVVLNCMFSRLVYRIDR